MEMIDYDLVLYVYNSIKCGNKPAVDLNKIANMYDGIENGSISCDNEVLVSMIYFIVEHERLR